MRIISNLATRGCAGAPNTRGVFRWSHAVEFLTPPLRAVPWAAHLPVVPVQPFFNRSVSLWYHLRPFLPPRGVLSHLPCVFKLQPVLVHLLTSVMFSTCSTTPGWSRTFSCLTYGGLTCLKISWEIFFSLVILSLVGPFCFSSPSEAIFSYFSCGLNSKLVMFVPLTSVGPFELFSFGITSANPYQVFWVSAPFRFLAHFVSFASVNFTRPRSPVSVLMLFSYLPKIQYNYILVYNYMYIIILICCIYD